MEPTDENRMRAQQLMDELFALMRGGSVDWLESAVAAERELRWLYPQGLSWLDLPDLIRRACMTGPDQPDFRNLMFAPSTAYAFMPWLYSGTRRDLAEAFWEGGDKRASRRTPTARRCIFLSTIGRIREQLRLEPHPHEHEAVREARRLLEDLPPSAGRAEIWRAAAWKIAYSLPAPLRTLVENESDTIQRAFESAKKLDKPRTRTARGPKRHDRK